MNRLYLLIVLFAPVILFGQSADDELVNIKELIPYVVLDLKYSTIDNFTGQKLYTTNECLMTLGAIRWLILVQDSLKKITHHNGKVYPEGLGIKIWDAYRPRAVQYLMWEIFPNPTYVANPTSGSVHNRGGAIDLTLIDMATGEELAMPTEFDYFGEQAWHWFTELPADVIANRQLLYEMMTNVAGFEIYSKEWWHYTWTPSKAFPLQDFQMK